MEYLKTLPNNAFQLAVVDPPYGDAGDAENEHRNQRGRFNKYNAPRERERETVAQRTIVSEPPDHDLNGIRVTRTGGTWAEKYGKKS